MPRQGQIHYYTSGIPLKANIVNQDDYRLDVRLTELRNNNWQLEITRFILGYGETKLELFLTDDELAQVRKQLDVTG